MSVAAQPAEPAWARFASFALSPRFVLAVIWTAIIIGVITSASWGVPLFWALMALTAFVTAFALLGAKPLPALKEQSHLILRLSWLVRYGTATVVLCLSTFLGALAGFQAGASDAQSLIDGAGGLIGVVGLWATKIVAVLFFGWLVIDVFRMSDARRRKGIKRAIRKVVPGELREIAAHPVIVAWLLALSSRLIVTVSLVAIAITLLMALNSTSR